MIDQYSLSKNCDSCLGGYSSISKVLVLGTPSFHSISKDTFESLVIVLLPCLKPFRYPPRYNSLPSLLRQVPTYFSFVLMRPLQTLPSQVELSWKVMMALPVRIPISESAAEMSTSPLQERISPTSFSKFKIISLYNLSQANWNSQRWRFDALPEIRSPFVHFPLMIKKILSQSPFSSPPKSPLFGSSKMVMIPSSSSALLFRMCPKQQPRGYTMSPLPLLRGLMMSLLISTILGISSLDFYSISQNQTVQSVSLI